ncbi:MAG: ribonuclease III family protein [Promethearchaeota archaeon]
MESLGQFGDAFSDLTQIARDRGLAKIGDAFVNLVYSAALSVTSGALVGEKVSKKILAGALNYANLKQYAPRRADSHAMADSVEAILGYCWIRGLLPLGTAIDLLIDGLETAAAGDAAPIECGVQAFGALLEHVKAQLPVAFFEA